MVFLVAEILNTLTHSLTLSLSLSLSHTHTHTHTQTPNAHWLSNGHAHPRTRESSSAQTHRLEEEKELVQLRKTVKKLDARVTELIATNEQWAIEAGEAASERAVLQIQLQDKE